MVSDVNERTLDRRAPQRVGVDMPRGELVLRGVGVVSLLVGAASLVVFMVFEPEVTLVIAGTGAVLALLVLALHPMHRRYAIAGLFFSVVSFSYAVALILFGSAR